MLFKPSAVFPEFDVEYEPYGVVFKTTEYKHDSLELTLPGSTVSLTSPFVSGTPVKVSWAPGGTFYGYVDRVLPRGVNVPRMLMKVVCVGATYPLKQPDFRSYRDITIPTVIANVCDEFNIGSLLEQNDTVWQTLSQGGTSTWKFFVELSKKIGYTMFPSDSTLVALNRRTAVTTNNQFAYHFHVKNHSYFDDSHDLKEALSFQPKSSTGDGLVDNLPGKWSINVASRYSGDYFKRVLPEQEQAPLFERLITDKIATTLEEADALLRAATSLHNFSQRAKLTVRMNPSIRAGSVIDLNLFDQNEMFKGLWLVTNVEHSIATYDRIVSVTNIDMVRNPEIEYLPSEQPNWSPAPLPPTVYRNRRWEAAWSTR